ncbi:hypothetical protein [Spiroplasma chrysopicola]|uniref:Uncharacterized protein n=1 Tax=Spiroplasma chrysopicola DF-1 TaxID=1276227 RepID=R4UB97_9MOLU|nr:hypothetical protein [Spiroplasma chrysopicola]AGM25149.1 hypothetical protein SCHRY_v1c05710 [Spiroplasma chrysopicola DF-1]
MENLNNKLDHRHYWWVKNTLFRLYTKEQILDAFNKINNAVEKAKKGQEISPWTNDTELDRKHYWWIRSTLFKHYEYEILMKIIKNI